MNDRDEGIKRIRKALKAKTGKTWSVTGGRGTAWGWITVEAPPRRRINHEANPEYVGPWEYSDVLNYVEVQPPDGTKGWYTSDVERKQIAQAFGLDRPVHHQGLSILPDSRDFYVMRAEKGAR